jgi:hypothetical protein
MEMITYIIILGSILVAFLLGKYSTKQKVANIKDWVEMRDSVTELVCTNQKLFNENLKLRGQLIKNGLEPETE